MCKRITINDLIEKLNKLPESWKEMELTGIGVWRDIDDNQYYYRFHLGADISMTVSEYKK